MPATRSESSQAILRELLRAAGLRPSAAKEVEIAGADPVLATRFRIGEAAAGVLGAVGVAVCDLWELRCGRRQRVQIDVQAATASLISFVLLHMKGVDLRRHVSEHPTTALYPTADGRWVHLHGGFPHLRDGTLRLLDADDDAAALAAAVSRWEALELEEALAEGGLCGAMVRSREEWDAHPQAAALADRPVVEVTRIGDGPPLTLAPAGRPLSGIRVLDLTRVLAGPACARTLAEHGADVLRIGSPHLPSIPPFVLDTGHGKLSAHLDLRREDHADQLRALIAEADVFSQGYRSGALEQLGFGVEELVARRPGIVLVSINCYGHEGPWRERRGWEQLAQSVTGIAHEQGGSDPPRLVPAAATDYTTGYLGALGALIALARRAREGGSYHVRVSLARTGMWLGDLGRTQTDRGPGLDPAHLAPYLVETDTPQGRLRHLGPVLRMSETPPRWTRPAVPLGTHPAAWPGPGP